MEEKMMKHIKKLFMLIAIALLVSMPMTPGVSFAHCQIPCGIYNDYARVMSMFEDAATIKKSITLIAELSDKADAQSRNQVVRWVTNKEKHAQNIIDTISDYFLTQRVKPNQKDYSERLAKHHAVILAAMGAKQNTDMKYATVLQDRIKELLAYYPEKKQ
jgi:nickel superoxide dismutase